MSNNLWLNYYTDIEYFNMNSQEKKLYEQGLKELAKYYYYTRKYKTKTHAKTNRIYEGLLNLIYDQNGNMTSLGTFIYFFSLSIYLFYFSAFIQATNITGPFVLFVYLLGSIGGCWLISTKIFQLEEDTAFKISGIISFLFPFLLLMGLFMIPPLHSYYNSVSSVMANFLKRI